MTGGAGNVLKLTLHAAQQSMTVSGTARHGRFPRLLSCDGIDIEAPLEGTLLFLRNRDVPGVIGKIGTTLGDHDVNIANFALGRADSHDGNGVRQALAVIHMDVETTPAQIQVAMEALGNLKAITSVRLVKAELELRSKAPDQRRCCCRIEWPAASPTAAQTRLEGFPCMPLYEYECKQCHQRLEKIQSFSAPHETICPKCGGEVERVISAPAIQFKGAGWYVNDYAKSGSKTASSTDSSSKSDGKSDISAASADNKSDSGSSKPAASTSDSSSASSNSTPASSNTSPSDSSSKSGSSSSSSKSSQ